MLTQLVQWEDLRAAAATNGKIDLDLLQLAYETARDAHGAQERKSGEAYVHHPLAVAKKLAEMGLDQATVIAGLLHDVPEDTSYSLADVEKNFGNEVAKLVAGVTKLGKLKYRGMDRYAENLRKMFIAMAEDLRVVLIKFADRLHNLSTLASLPEEKRFRIATETLEIYGPIADRLGMGAIKGIMEDLSFKTLMPREYAEVERQMADRAGQLENKIVALSEKIKELLRDAGVAALSVHGRHKHYYSLYRKLQRKGNDITKIYDLVALRIIVPTVADCYHALGLIHAQWTPMPGRIKDYVALPKANGYQSLHTAVVDESGDIFEIQIRTQEMHDDAEYGIAAHWHYKRAGSAQAAKDVKETQVRWLKDLAEWQKDLSNEQFVDAVKVELFQHRIFCLTPHGDAIDLPENAVTIDFAYAVHTDVGHSCAGAKVNGSMVSLDTELKSGDVVEIIRDKNRKKPNADWLSFAKTHGAREKIRAKLRALGELH